MEQEIKVKRTEYGFVTVDIPEGEDAYDIVYEEYTSGNVNWGDEEFEVLSDDGEAERREDRLETLLLQALSVIREKTECLDEMDYQKGYVQVLVDELGMTPKEIMEFTGIEVDVE